MKIISASINLNKINKSKLIKGKDGNEYLNISIICNDSENEWGKDVSITEGQSEQERKDKVKKNFIGNGKTVYNSDKQF
ncbi:hypothetical protein EBU24_05110 [bacterium]|jgi:hypothetical protein|nr:hypothetical protein [bacterium]